MPHPTNKLILVVDDSSDHQILLRQLFESEGYLVISAANGKEALDSLKSASQLPAFILLDLMMPIMDGNTFRQEQLKDTRLASIPIVVMTADGHLDPKLVTFGTCEHLRKPVDIDVLLGLAKKYCG